MIYIDETYMRSVLVKRREDAHKGDFGKVLLFAGSTGMAGAAVLCGRAALKSGAGLVRYLLPSYDTPLLPILQISVPEATCVEGKQGMDWQEYSAIAAGSGLGPLREDDRKDILRSILADYTGVLVLDADALNLIAADPETADLTSTSRAQIIMTPHVGEAKRLLHICEGIRGLPARKDAACALAQQYHCIAVLKGSGTLVAQENEAAPADGAASPHAERFVISQNTSGNPGMATGGSGDSLTGVIASLAGQGYTALEAARLGVYIHGKAGDLAAERLGQMGMTAADIVDQIPYAIK